MKEGAWIRAKTGEFWWVDEHCMFAKSQQGADAMGLPQRVRQEIEQYSCDFKGSSRESVLIAVMKAGYIRFRGHGAQLTCEFWGPTQDNLWASYEFLSQMAGPFSYCVINNLRTKEQIALTFQELEKRMKEDHESVLRIAKTLVRNASGVGFTTVPEPGAVQVPYFIPPKE